MMNKNLKKIAISILLLAVMLFGSVVVFAVAGAESDVKEYTLTVTIPDDANFGTVELTIGDGAPEILESGKAYTITTGVRYKLLAKPLTGYGETWKNLIAGTGTPLLEGVMNSDIHYEVRFTPKKYAINYVDEHLYSFDVNDTSLIPREHVYKSVVSIPNVSRPGYEFDGWILYYSDPSLGNIQGLVCEKDYSASFNATDIWLKPMWKGDQYCVIRLDCWYKERVPYNNGGYLGYQIFAGEMGAFVDGSMGDATEYTGYTFLDDTTIYDYLAHQKQVSISETYGVVGIERIIEKIADIQGNPELAGYNIVFRYYLPNQYDIDVDLNADGDEVTYENGKIMPQYHVYNENTFIPNPVRAGYDFSHWLVTVNGVVQADPYYPGHTIIQGTVEGDITLKAVWTPKTFSIQYEWGGKDDADNEAIALLNNTLLSKYNTYTYGVLTEFPYPVRTGYGFDGWIVTQNGEVVYEVPIKDLTLDLFNRLPMGFTLSAQWSAATYTVTLYGNGADDAVEPTLSVRYDSALDTTGVQIPKRFGYSFLGYFTDPTAGEKYINADGSSACAVWTLAEDTVLYAHWKELPKVSAPAFLIDYTKETFYCADGKIPLGHYEFSYGETVMDVVVTQTSITVDGHIIASVNSIPIPNEFIGQTVTLKVFGDGTTTSHHYVSFVLNARPKAPTGVSENDDVVSIIAKYTEITVKMKADTAGFKYEFAISVNPNGTGLVWQDSPVFENLTQGTVYYVYVRAKALDGSYPHGAEFVSDKVYTLYQSYVDEMKEALDALKQTTDGAMVESVIKDAKAQMSLLEPSANFHETLNQIYEDAKREVLFARKQDDKLNALQSTLDTMKSSGAYSENSLLTLQTIFNNAQEGIKALTLDDLNASDRINEIYEQAHQAMYAVRVTYLFSGDMELNAHEGLHQSSLLTLLKITDLGTLNASVNNAIKLGKVTVNDLEMTVEDAIRELRSKELLSAYSMQLKKGILAVNEFEGSFTFRLLLPQELRNIDGLRVAFYNDKTGQLEVLNTVVDGNVLEFYASSIGDFVILGDPIIDLTNLLWALASILLLQTLAIILLLIRRKKATMNLQNANYAVAPIVGLTIRISPDYALTAIVIFGVLILLFQIFLIYLLLSSDLVSRHGKRIPKRTAEETDGEEPIYLDTSRRDASAVASEAENDHEDEPVLHSLTDADVPEGVGSYGELYETDEEYVEQTEAPVQADPATDDGAAYTNAFVEFEERSADDYDQAAQTHGEAEYGYDENGQTFIVNDGTQEDEPIEGASYYGVDEDSFIEPSANPNYSLPEEEYSEESKEEYYEEDFEEGEEFFEEELAQGEQMSSSFEFDDEELATGDDYYDEPVPFDENEGRLK